MSAIASPEFVSLCRAQLRLLAQQMDESTAALYMANIAETAAGETSHFVPVVSYPGSVDDWTKDFSPASWEAAARAPLALPIAKDIPIELDSARAPKVATEPIKVGAADRSSARAADSPPQPEQLVVPLVYTDVVVGLLVTVRRDRPWQSAERTYIETMADSLAAGCVLERRNQWLQSRVTYRRGLQSRQSEIFHNLLHQFRNPLTAVNTFGKLLVKRLGPDDPNQTVATGIVREASRLKELVGHFDETVALGDADLNAASAPLLASGQPLLPQAADTKADLERTRATNSESLEDTPLEDPSLDNSLGHALTLSRQSIAQIVNPILEVASIVAEEKGVKLHAQISRNTPSVWGEEEALSEVVSNLVDNAVKYAPSGAQVWIQTGVSRIEGKHHYQGIVVADTGPGIPAADLERLFERYYRGVQAEGNLPGTGLGLAIAQSLVQEMQGAIEVISPAVDTPWLPTETAQSSPGPGTVFIVWLLEAS